MAFAFVFPGPGFAVRRHAERARRRRAAGAETFAEASDVLGYDLWKLCQEGPEEQLGTTERTQPAMLAAGVATWRVWRKHGGGLPAAMAGHSLGEYSALVCSGALDFRTAVGAGAVSRPGDAGSGAGGAGRDGRDPRCRDADVEAACREAAQGEVVQAANFNSPGQVVIAGTAAAVDRAIEVLKAKGAKRAIKLPVSVPSHSALMAACGRTARRSGCSRLQFDTPKVRDIYTVDVRKHGDADEHSHGAGANSWSSRCAGRKRSRRCVAGGARVIVECGPGACSPA